MEIEKIRNIFINEINSNKKTINDAISEESEKYGKTINISSLIQMISESIIPEENINSMAIKYNGHPEVTVYMLLYSVTNDCKVGLYYDSYNIINIVLISIFENILKELNVYKRIRYIEENSQNKLIEEQDNYKKILFVGDCFEYENLQYFIRKKMAYNSFGFVKMFIDTEKFKKEYIEILKYSYINNIYVEIYDDFKDLINNIRNEDYVLVYTTDEEIKNICYKYYNIILNKNSFNSYHFKYNN